MKKTWETPEIKELDVIETLSGSYDGWEKGGQTFNGMGQS